MRADIVRPIVRQGAIAGGAVVGLSTAAVLTRWLESLLYDVCRRKFRRRARTVQALRARTAGSFERRLVSRTGIEPAGVRPCRHSAVARVNRQPLDSHH